ncbi:MAG: hypothetical protein EOP23_03985 [Hyphomicrobiales bacterium]|nr:MAG: hypothetical protein EOP23_03985 [Hyphomicrobiales bacterium]
MPSSFSSPEDLALLEGALDQARAIVEARRGHDPLTAPGEKERLAYIVASMWGQGEQDELPAKAADHFEATAPLLPPLTDATDKPSV